ncbi:unnamed protein product [Didymodactylos carnosus]|uniref:Uncharacterized protein n=1 Tax=Didymodactylos carnosus TaxID=1234261 RepID=A0A813PH68_9BILA|nr:unnamed protein product [Didymodactylos carnosus]CAF3532747.1 unnamed protein product [Didymodactylos carnosus]
MPLIPRNFGHYPIQFTSPPSNGYHHGYANYGYQGMGLSQRQYNYQMTSPQFARPYQKNSGYQYGYGPYYGGGTQNMIQPYKKPGIGAQFLMLLNGIEQQLQYESYMRNLRAYENNQRKFYRRQQQYFPPTIHRPSHPPIIPPPLYTNNNRSIVAEYEREIRYEPFPIFITKPNLHSGHNIGGPKYIFVPISYPPFQSSMGPLVSA